MTFLFPLGLLSLLSLLVVVWIHLRRQRLKRVIVPSLMLWQKVSHSGSNIKRRRLPITPFLLLHLLIAALISIALGQPQREGWFLDARHHVVVIIDTSTSMAAKDDATNSRLDVARAKTQSLMNSLSAQDRISFITAGTHAHVLATGGLSNFAMLSEALDRMQATGNGTAFETALSLSRTLFQTDPDAHANDQRRIVIFSDQEQPTEMPSFDYPIEWVRVGGTSDNRAIVAFAAKLRSNDPKAGYHLYARMANYSSVQISTHVRLYGDNRLIDDHLLVFKPEGEIEYEWNIPAHVKIVRAEMDGQDRLDIDDHATLSLQQTRMVRTLLVSNQSSPLERLLKAIPELSVVTVRPDEYGSSSLVAKTDLTIFDGTLAGITAFPEGSVLINHPPNSALLPMGASNSITGTIHAESPSYAFVDELGLDSSDFGPIAAIQKPDWVSTLVAAQDYPLILRGHIGKSNVEIWTFDVHHITTKLAFPILVARSLRDIIPDPLPMSVLVGTSFVLATDPRTDTIEWQAPDGEKTQKNVHPTGQSLRIEHLEKPGLYTIIERKGDHVLYEGHVAVNAGSSLESDLRPHPAVLGKSVQPIPIVSGQPLPTLQMKPAQKPMWSWFVIAALFVLMIEWLYFIMQGKGQKNRGLS